MVMGPEQMATGAGGGQMPQMMSQMSSVTSVPGQTQAGGDMGKVLEAISYAVQQFVIDNGVVDMDRLIAMWPQIAQQFGLNIPFQTILQLIQQNPEILEDIAVQHGLSGSVKFQGKVIPAEQLVGMGTGAIRGGQ